MRPGRVRLLLAIAWAAVVLPCLPVRELMPPDEPRFGQVAEEMREGGHWIVPHLAGRVYGDKPPVLFWAVNLAAAPFGRVGETTARIPSALAALATILLTARLARRVTGSADIALGSGLALLTSVEFFQRAQWVSTDMLLAAFCLTAAVFWSEALFGSASAASPPGPGARVPEWADAEAPSRRMLFIFLIGGWLAVTAAVLTKGPIALFWAAAWPVAEGFARRQAGRLWRILHPAGIALFVAIAGSWLALAERVSGGGYIREVLVHQSVDRYLHAWNNQQPWHFYLHQFPLDLAPWSLLLPAGLACAFYRRGGPDRIPALAATATLGAALLLFSFTEGKRGVYLLPAFPAASLLVAIGFFEAGRTGAARLFREVPMVLAGLLGVLLAATGLFLRVGGTRMAPLDGWLGSAAPQDLHAIGLLLLAAAGALVAGAVSALVASRKGRPLFALSAVSAALCVVWILVGIGGGTIANRHQNAADFGRQLAARVPAGERLAIERGKFELILFYSGRTGFEFEKASEMKRAAASGAARFALIEEPTWQALASSGGAAGIETLWQGSISTTHYRLLRLASSSGA